jgi:hypothetical protein
MAGVETLLCRSIISEDIRQPLFPKPVPAPPRDVSQAHTHSHKSQTILAYLMSGVQLKPKDKATTHSLVCFSSPLQE